MAPSPPQQSTHHGVKISSNQGLNPEPHGVAYSNQSIQESTRNNLQASTQVVTRTLRTKIKIPPSPPRVPAVQTSQDMSEHVMTSQDMSEHVITSDHQLKSVKSDLSVVDTDRTKLKIKIPSPPTSPIKR